MISGLSDAILLAWLPLAAAPTPTSDLDSFLASLAKEPPQSIAFVEVHTSPLLEHEFVVAGTLEYAAPGRLSRIVTEPYQERSDIDYGEVRIVREGRPERRFSLRRNPELGGLLAAFSALLSGDRATLEENFEPSLTAEAKSWQLDLAPRRAGPRNRIGQIRVRGTSDMPACIVVFTKDGEATTEILLGAAASNPDRERMRKDHCGV